MLSITREQIKEEIKREEDHKYSEIDRLKDKLENCKLGGSYSIDAELGGLMGTHKGIIRFWESLLKYVEE